MLEPVPSVSVVVCLWCSASSSADVYLSYYMRFSYITNGLGTYTRYCLYAYAVIAFFLTIQLRYTSSTKTTGAERFTGCWISHRNIYWVCPCRHTRLLGGSKIFLFVVWAWFKPRGLSLAILVAGHDNSESCTFMHSRDNGPNVLSFWFVSELLYGFYTVVVLKFSAPFVLFSI